MITNLLIVTDHTTHASTNSLYELAVALATDRLNINVWVCSRGIEPNRDFFKGIVDAGIYATSVNDSFAFHPKGLSLNQTAIRIDQKQVNAILVRMPQPLDQVFLRSLSKIVPNNMIINSPEGTIETSSKAFLLQVAHLCPSPSLCMNLHDAIALSQQQEIVLKPLYSYGGKGIVRLSTDYYWEGDNRYDANEITRFLPDDHFPMLAMKYLRNVSQGDKRTIVVNRKILGSALRLPAPNSWICNVAHGGHAIMSLADEEEMKIEKELTPILFEKGVIMYGFDTLVDDDGMRVLSEINTLSIGGIGPMEEMSGMPILRQAARLIWEYLEKG